MTRKQLRRTLFAVISFYACTLIASVIIYYSDHSEKKSDYYQIIKDLMPLIITIPAAYLGFCFQRRSSFLQALRQVWSNLVLAVNSAIQYTHQTDATVKVFGDTLVIISKSIDEVRGVYKNLNETKDDIGLYPFECLKEIHKIVSLLGYGSLDVKKTTEARKHIRHNWGDLRKSFLSEFDRSEPTIFNSPYFEK
jgi:hypothetical protein